ncbi:MAG: hypothetical protein IT285_11575 [Bdellovibrionales bacterium]|nr:hypothetical protein [Bdellovibrionales bacterium]
MISLPTKKLLPRAGLLLALGAVLGPIGDWFHVATGTTSYPPDFAWYFPGNVPWWVPLLFGSATLAIGLSHPLMDDLARRMAPKWAMRTLWGPRTRPGMASALGLVGPFLMFEVAYIASGYLPRPPGGAADLILISMALVCWAAFDSTIHGGFLALSTGFVGSFAEWSLIQAGVFRYEPGMDNLFGVASWLPWIYCCASVGAGHFGRFIRDGFERP